MLDWLSSSSATTSLASPYDSASAESIGRPRRRSSDARDNPTAFAKVMETPESGTRPIPRNAVANFARSATMRRSQASAIPSPAPAQAPLTAAITGFPSLVSVRTIGLYSEMSVSKIAAGPRRWSVSLCSWRS